MPWFWRGLGEPVKTLGPGETELAGGTPGRPVPSVRPPGAFDVGVCPTAALERQGDQVAVRHDRCVYCMRCRSGDGALDWALDSDWAVESREPLGPGFARSIHMRILDSGDCGGCLNELRQLHSPLYSLHRFGVFVTPTPRQADVLVVVGPVTEGMAGALHAAYVAMPEPKRVMALGVCALNGGVFAPSFAVRGGASAVVPVDIAVPGCPPPPLAILSALRTVMGRPLASATRAGEVGR